MSHDQYLLIDEELHPKQVKVRTRCSIELSFSLNFSLPFESFLIFRLRGGRNNKNDWYFLQNHDPQEKGFANLIISPKVELEPIILTGKELAIKYLILEKDGIKEGTKFFFSVQNTLVQSIVEAEKRIEVLVQFPSKQAIQLKNVPTLKVVHSKLDHVTLLCPSTVSPDEKFQILARLEDKYYNLVEDSYPCLDVFQVDSNDNRIHLFSTNEEEIKGGILIREDLKLKKEGIHYYEIQINGKRFKSNPIKCVVSSSNKKLYWGFIHGHTNKSDGVISSEAYFENLTKAGLDFGTSTEHDHAWETSDEDFKEIKKLVRIYNQKNNFVSFFGYEYGTWYTGYGDICIYYIDDEIPIFRSENNKYNSIPKLIRKLAPWKDKVLMICHHSALRPGHRNWKYFNNELEKLVEIYSTWGNQEYSFLDGNPLPPRYKFFGYGSHARKRGAILEKRGSFVKDALKRGYKLGFTAGGDDHLGAYPSGPIDIDNGIYPPGITAVWSKNLTKENIWEALHQRHCYGTTGPRIILEFFIDNYMMGDIINLKDYPELTNKRNLKLKIVSPLKILKVELIRNNDILKKYAIEQEQIEISDVDSDSFYSVSLKHLNCREEFIFYYLRVFLENSELSWSSPIWVIRAIT